MANHPQIEMYTAKVDAFMAKYPKITMKGERIALVKNEHSHSSIIRFSFQYWNDVEFYAAARFCERSMCSFFFARLYEEYKNLS
jgi:hypothetical protein